ncbi:AP-4 complex subunit mu-1 [Chiloscyllium plagiosum]|nr:AP-4 complex subunit mu-1 [Chiloscyllium plagiosum]
MISQLFIVSARGDHLIYKDLRGEESKDVVDIFYQKVRSLPRDQAPVVMHHQGLQFIHIRQDTLYLVATTRCNVSPFTVVQFLVRLVSLIKDHCGTLNEKTLQLNFALVYELLDEMLDYGYIQTTSSDILKNFIQTVPETSKQFNLFELSNIGLFGADTQQSKVAPSIAASRPVFAMRTEEGLKTEIFVDVIERLTVVIGANGSLMRADVQGEVRMKCFLPSSTEIRMGLNEEFSIGKADIRGTVHTYALTTIPPSFVSSAKFETVSWPVEEGLLQIEGVGRTVLMNTEILEALLGLKTDKSPGPDELHPRLLKLVQSHINTIICICVDSPFSLSLSLSVSPQLTVMQYSLSDDLPVSLPFRLFPTVDKDTDSNRLMVYLKLRCDLSPKSQALNVTVHLPVPKGTTSLSQELSSPDQRAELDSVTRSVHWTIPRFHGGSQLSALFKLEVPGLSASSLLELGPVCMQFELPMSTCSGLQVRFLRVSSTHPPLPHRWVRYVTHSDSYVIRL